MRGILHLILFGSLLLSNCNASETHFPASQRKAMDSILRPTFQLEDNFEIELFAADPLLKDPVAMTVDESGRLFVAEMPGYPLDINRTGRIVLLLDHDADGYPDERLIFADDLVLPTGILPWKGGLIVTDAPDVLFLKDTNGDGKADHREVLLTGFALSNPQHNLNSPVYGLDNWIYLAHENTISTKTYEDQFGDEGQEIHFPNQQKAERLPVNANGRSVRFRPASGDLDMLASKTQFGHSFSPWGHYFQTMNADHLFHEVIASRYLTRKSELLASRSMQYLPDYGKGFEVFAITQDPNHQLLSDIGTMTSACGISWYQGGIFPKAYEDVIFTCEPTHNLIHADRIVQKGASFRAEQIWKDKEFLASTDAQFRPVNTYIGPDGALYIVDYYRQIIEHPEWMEESVVQSGKLYEGSDKGRIYRIFPKGQTLEPWLQKQLLTDKDLQELVTNLSHSNIWWRINAQRLLTDQNDKSAIPALESLLNKEESPLGALHALWTLDGLENISGDHLRNALQHKEAGLRENAIILIEKYLDENPGWSEWLFPLVEDPDPRVRFQLLCTLGEVASEAGQKARKELLIRDLQDPWVHLAAMSSPYFKESDFLMSYSIKPNAKPKLGEAAFLKSISASSCLVEPEMRTVLINMALDGGNKPDWWRLALLDGVYQAVTKKRLEIVKGEVLKKLSQGLLEDERALRTARLKLLDEFGGVKGPIPDLDKNWPDEKLADAIRLISLMDALAYKEEFQAFISFQYSTIVQSAAIEALGRIKGLESCQFFLEKWPSLSPEIRQQTMKEWMKSSDRMYLLLESIENGKIDPKVIGWRRTVRLMNHGEPKIRAKARKVLHEDLSNRAEVATAFWNQTPKQGKIAEGKKIFQQQCSICHTYQGTDGTPYGPDLAAVRNRTAQSIVTDILMPNRSIADGFEIWTITLDNKEEIIGIIAAETPNALTIRDAAGNETVIARNEMAKMEPMSVSGMPIGMEKQISHQQMADLLAYIQQVE